MSNVLQSTDATFGADIAKWVTFIDFWAPWCGPCQVMIPRLDELSAKIWDKAKIMKMNVDEEMKTAQWLWIRSIPTMIIFKDGKPVEQFNWITEVSEIEKAILKHI